MAKIIIKKSGAMVLVSEKVKDNFQYCVDLGYFKQQLYPYNLYR
jgi:hypothetical protein